MWCISYLINPVGSIVDKQWYHYRVIYRLICLVRIDILDLESEFPQKALNYQTYFKHGEILLKYKYCSTFFNETM